MKSKKAIIALIVVALLVLGYGIKTWLFAPQINPDPKQKILIHGTFPFDKDLSLAFQVTYKSTNPTCRQAERVFLIFEAAEVARTKNITPEVRKVSDNQFEAIIYLDQIETGFCEWEYSGISYTITGRGITEKISRALGDIPKNVKSAAFVCKDRQLVSVNATSFSCSIKLGQRVDNKLAPAQLDFIWNGN